MMTAGTGGFSGSAPATGPNAGFDPIMKFRKKLKKTKVKLNAGNANESFSESKENPKAPSRLFQYKVKLPEVGETIVYASSPAELARKLRMVIAPGHRGDIEIERYCPQQQVSSSWISAQSTCETLWAKKWTVLETPKKWQMKEFVLKEREQR